MPIATSPESADTDLELQRLVEQSTTPGQWLPPVGQGVSFWRRRGVSADQFGIGGRADRRTSQNETAMALGRGGSQLSDHVDVFRFEGMELLVDLAGQGKPHATVEADC